MPLDCPPLEEIEHTHLMNGKKYSLLFFWTLLFWFKHVVVFMRTNPELRGTQIRKRKSTVLVGSAKASFFLIVLIPQGYSMFSRDF